MSAAIWARLGEGCLGKPGATESVLLFFLVNCGRARRTEGRMLGSRARASWWAPGSRSGVGDGSSRALVAISEVVICWRYQSMCTAPSQAMHLDTLSTLFMSLLLLQACTRDMVESNAKSWPERSEPGRWGPLCLHVFSKWECGAQVTLRFSSVVPARQARPGNKRPLRFLRLQPPTQRNATPRPRPGTLLSCVGSSLEADDYTSIVHCQVLCPDRGVKPIPRITSPKGTRISPIYKGGLSFSYTAVATRGQLRKVSRVGQIRLT